MKIFDLRGEWKILVNIASLLCKKTKKKYHYLNDLTSEQHFLDKNGALDLTLQISILNQFFLMAKIIRDLFASGYLLNTLLAITFLKDLSLSLLLMNCILSCSSLAIILINNDDEQYTKNKKWQSI